MRAPRRRARRLAVQAGGLLVLCWLLFAYVVRQPSNDRDWEFGFERTASVEASSGVVTLHNVRDYEVTDDGGVEPRFVDRVVDLGDVEGAWFLYEPFRAFPFDFRGIAHTYFVFDVHDAPPIGLSVEARRERNEPFSAWSGLFNQYELTYIWATEEDLTIKRVMVEHNDVYMFPLLISPGAARGLLDQLARTSAELEHTPRFYNTLVSNCTNELALAANSARPGAIPLSVAWVLPGYSIDDLHALGFIPHDRPLPEVERQYRISDTVRRIHRDPDFSAKLRASLGR